MDIGTLTGYLDMETGPFEGALDKVGDFLSEHVSGWKGALTAGGLALGGVFAGSLVGAMDLEPGRDKIAASLGLSEKQAKTAGEVAGKVYANGWGDSADDVNDAVEAVMSSIKGMRNASAKDLQAVTENALAFAQAMDIDVGQAAQVAGTMVTNHLAKNATDAFDLMTAGLQRVPKELRGDVTDALSEYSKNFAQVGLQGDQAMALFVQGSQNGAVGIDKVGDSIKELTIRATDLGDSGAQQALKAIGLNGRKVGDDLLAGGKKGNAAMQSIVRHLLAVKDPAKRATAAVALMGGPVEDLGKNQLPKFLRSLQAGEKGLGKYQGAAKRAGDTLSDNAQNHVSTFVRTLKGAFVNTLGNKVLPVLDSFTGVLSDDLGPALDAAGKILQKVTGFFADHRSAAYSLIGVVGALTAVTLTYSAVQTVAAAGGMLQFIKGLKLVRGVTRVATAVQWAYNAAISANPLMLIVIAVAAVVGALILVATKTKWGHKIMVAAWNGIKQAVHAVANFFAHTLPDFFVKAWNKIKSVTTGGISKVIGWVKGIPGKIKGGLSSLVGTVRDLFSNAMHAGLDLVRNLGGSIVDWVRSIPGKLGNLVGRFGSAGKALIHAFVDGMKNAAGIISGIAGNVWDAVKGLLNGAISKLNAAFDFKISLPGPDIHVNLPDIPHLATGGRATSGMLAVIGEGREPESVLPDSVLRGLLERVHTAGVDAGRQRATGRQGPLIDKVVMQPGTSVGRLAEELWFKTRTRG